MAITAVYFRPKVWSPAYNPIVWSFASDKASEIDFSYVVDVYINQPKGTTGAYSHRIKQRPNPSGICMIDVSPIVQSYIDLSNYTTEEGWHNLDFPNDPVFRDSEGIAAWVHLKVGEEYRGATGAPLTIFDGYGVTGDPAYPIYCYDFDDNVRAIPSALSYNESIQNMSATGSYGVYSDYIMDGDGKFLKRGPSVNYLNSNDHHSLTFLNWWEGATGSYNFVYQANIDLYSATGASISTDVLFTTNNTTNFGGPLPGSTGENIKYDFLTLQTGPADWPTLWAGYEALGVSYYDIYLKNYTGPAGSQKSIASEKVRFYVNTTCDNLYPTVRLSWLNDLGGRDYYNFTMFYESTSNSEQETYNQTSLKYSDFLPVAMATEGDTTSNWIRGGDKIFNKVVSKEFEIQTDWLTQEYVDFLGGIPESSSVWAYIGDDPTPVTVVVSNLSYTYKNVKQTKLVQATMKCRITKVQQKQNL